MQHQEVAAPKDSTCAASQVANSHTLSPDMDKLLDRAGVRRHPDRRVEGLAKAEVRRGFLPSVTPLLAICSRWTLAITCLPKTLVFTHSRHGGWITMICP